MKIRTLLSSFFALLLAVPTLHATDWAAVVKQVEKSIMYLETDGSACTAFVINQAKHYAMTAAHCAPAKGDDLWVDRVGAKVISKDSKKDLLVLEIKDLDPTRPALKIATKNPERGQEVMSAGFGLALERPFFRQAHVQDDETTLDAGVGGPYISLDATFVGGQSGGPVVNHAGEVMLIVQRGSNTVGLGIGAETIRERMGRFLEK